MRPSLQRLAAHWAEVLGGPPRFSTECGDQARVLRMHAGNGDMTDLGERFERCFAAAMDDAALPEDPAFRAAMRAYMHWAVAGVLAHPDGAADVDPRAAMPRWDWNGPAR
ncbi:hypothetical protein DVA67_032170 [Solirubrobacter sp. CPCC 204708]|uniref:Oxidoreductase n=1 Tax=Solirubrobacter deserti TaxID=2282478 RepID=A0ABT4RQL0_9ACTN|nr:hypothetical protein [Solirubrobacter deserti]MBE2320661.1 hypothetical protein [Solirubrobacter deserti]MDA0140713.1 hypothetical protein [Solirubrobacter deserti]